MCPNVELLKVYDLLQLFFFNCNYFRSNSIALNFKDILSYDLDNGASIAHWGEVSGFRSA